MKTKRQLMASGSSPARFQEAAMRAIRFTHPLAVCILFVFLAVSTVPGMRAQDEQRSTKVPLIGKVGGGLGRQAFSGKVQSVDTKRKLLTLEAVEGSYTEFFPVKGDFEVSAPGGKKGRVKELKPGTNVIVYYVMKNDRREVTDILVLGAHEPEKEPETKKPDSPS
jgi:hypothetical protein